MKQLIEIQKELKAPKNQYNNFGKYKYRNQEDILEALKPLLAKHGCTLTISDEIKEVAGLVYVEATAYIQNSDGLACSVSAQAGIDPNRKGMDIAQSFGSSSSYARKYALNGLFLIDDTKDPDTGNNNSEDGDSKGQAPTQGQRDEVARFLVKLPEKQRPAGMQKILAAKTVAELEEIKSKLLAL